MLTHITAWSFIGALLAAMPLHTSASTDICEQAIAKQQPASPYVAMCGTKPSCSASDVLELRPIVGAGVLPLSSATLCLNGTAAIVLPLPSSKTAATYPIPLAPLLREALAGDAAASDKLLAHDPKVPLPARIVMTAGANDTWQRAIEIDVNPLWSAGVAPAVPEVGTPVCASECGLSSSVFVPVKHLDAWRQALGVQVDVLQPVINGRRLTDVRLRRDVGEKGPGIAFDLPSPGNDAASQQTWRSVVADVLGGKNKVSLSFVGDKGTALELPPTKHLDFSAVAREADRWTVLIGALVVIGAIYVAVLKRDDFKWMRDSDDVPDTVVPRAERTFSLARCQMAWWMLIVPAASIAIGWGTGAWLNVDAQALALLGVGVGTAVAASAVMPQRLSSLVTASKVATEALSANSADPALQADQQAANTALKEELQSQGWWKDITRDVGSKEVGLHRVQSVLVTLALGGFVAWHAVVNGSFPTFTSTMLALIGVSGGAYVGFKAAAR